MRTFIILLLAAGNSFSQISPEWVAKYNGTGNGMDQSRYIAVDRSGNVYITGRSRPDSNGTTFDFVTIKYDPLGNQLWVQGYNGPAGNDDTPNSITVDQNGSVYIAGGSKGNGSGYDYALIKYSTTGNLLWVARYTTTVADIAYSVGVDNSGNAYVTGISDGSYFDDYATVKYNSEGVQQWVQRYNGTGNYKDGANALVVDIGGNVYVTGYSNGGSTGMDIATVKYNTSGTLQWVSRYAGPAASGGDYGQDITIDNLGNIYVTGNSYGVTGEEDYITIKINPSGNQIWAQRYNGPGNNIDKSNNISVDLSGNVFITGTSKGSGLLDDFATIKYNSDGEQVWLQRYNGTMNHVDEAKSLVVDSTGGVYISGVSRNNTTGNDITTIKYNSDGFQQWIAIFNSTAGNNSDYGESIAIDHLGNVFVTGYFASSLSSDDYITLKYSQSIGITQISNEIPINFMLHQNYPNPFNPITKIRFDVALDSRNHGSNKVVLKVFDVMGREITTLVNEKLNPGKYEVDFTAPFGDDKIFASGVYFYSFRAGDYFKTKKMVLIK